MLKKTLRLFGFDFTAFRRGVANFPRFLIHYRRFRAMAKACGSYATFPCPIRGWLPKLTDYGVQAGSARGHYFHQDIWAARLINQAKPTRHVDIGSRVDGFISHLLCFRAVEVIDIRPLTSTTRGLSFTQADATDLKAIPDASMESLSTLHALEHFGLGRYGDPLEPDAWRRAMRSLARVLAPNGRLYLSVPIGRQRVVFNAHRVFSPLTVIETMADLRLVSFAAVNDAGDLVEPADPADFVSAKLACGLFEFTKDPAKA